MAFIPNPLSRRFLLLYMFLLSFALILTVCGCSKDDEEVPEDQTQIDTDTTKILSDTLLTTDSPAEPAGSGVILSPDKFDSLAKLSNPISNEQWDYFFGHLFSNETETYDYSWEYYDTMECGWEITIVLTKRQNTVIPESDSYDEGKYKYFLRNGATAHNCYVAAPKASESVNCLNGPWDKTVIGYGITIIDYRVTWRKLFGPPTCRIDCQCEATGEALYKSTCWARTWVGFWCLHITRIANSYAVDQAQAVMNGSEIFRESAGAQSGDDVQVSISFELGGTVSSRDGVSATASVGQSETRLKNEGTAEDYLNAYGQKSVSACNGFIALNTGGKAFAKHDARAGARAHVWTKSSAVYLVVKCPGCGNGSIGWVAMAYSDKNQMDNDIDNLIKPFFSHHGFSNYPQ